MRRLGKKLTKIPVSFADTCPNRMGLKGMQTCIFCDEWGSAADSTIQALDLRSQIESTLKKKSPLYHTDDVLVYFQAYTSTFMATHKLREAFELALSFPNVRGLVMGTRPDCLSESIFALWNQYSEKTYVAVELGVQSFKDSALEFIRRGHNGETSIRAICQIKEKCKVDLCIHLIFGMPEETDADVKEAAQILNGLPVDTVKLHNLHVLKNTPLETMYLAKKFQPLTLDEYTRRTIHFLQHLSPRIAIERLSAVSSRWDELVAPEWTRYKMKTRQHILKEMEMRGAYQGQYYV